MQPPTVPVAMEASAGSPINFEIELFKDILNTDFTVEDVTASQIMNIPTQQIIKTSDGDGRFANPVNEKDLQKQKMNAVPLKTRQNNKWAKNIWREWSLYRNGKEETFYELMSFIPHDINMLSNKDINYWMQRFILEIRRKDGSFYPPNTLTQITASLQRYLRNDCDRVDINFFKDDDVTFAAFRKVLDAQMKSLTSQGIGCKRKSSEPVTLDEERLMWDKGVFSFHTAEGLSNAVFYYNGKAFAFRGMEQHKCVQADQFEIKFDAGNKRRYVRFTPRILKNSQGGLKNKNFSVSPIDHYEQPENPRCLVKLYDLYLSLIPQKGFFYRKPLQQSNKENEQYPRFSASNIPVGKLNQMFKNFYKQAGIDISGRDISNHSGRVTCCTTLYNEGFSDKAVISRSGHRSNAVHVYQREQFQIKDGISQALGPPLPILKHESEIPEKMSKLKTDSDLNQKNSTMVSETENENTLDDKENVPVYATSDSVITDNTILTLVIPESIKQIKLVKNGKEISITI